MFPKQQNFTPLLFSIVLLYLLPLSYQQVCNLHDQSSLLFFLDKISTPPSLTLNWTSSTSCCQWEGIRCNTNGNVTHLELPSKGLQGVITSSITRLINLRVLDLSLNNFFESIPHRIGNLRKLEKLYLNSNNLSGAIPSSLTSCTSLVEIILRSNHLSGDISNLDLTGFSQLQKLDLRNNSFNGTLPETIYSCRSLIAIGVSVNNISGQISTRILGLKSLSYLALTNNRFTNITKTLRLLSKCKSLRTLFLSYNFYGETLPIHKTFIGSNDFPKLEIFDLTGCNFGGPIPNWISNLKRLRHLNLNGNNMIGLIPSWLGILPNLYSLILAGNNLSGDFPLELCQLPKLLSPIVQEHINFQSELPTILLLPNTTNLYVSTIYRGIDLSNNALSGTIPPEIGNLRNIQQLFLNDNQFSGHIPMSISNFKKLEFLDLSMNNLTGEIPTSLGELSFLANFNVSNNDLQGPIPTGSQFDTFTESSFEGNPRLCGEALNRSCSNVTMLEGIDGNDGDHHFMDHPFLNGLFVGLASGFCGVIAIVASFIWFKY